MSLKAREAAASSKWRIAKRNAASYTGGTVAATFDGGAACMCAERVTLLDLLTGNVLRTIPVEVEVR